MARVVSRMDGAAVQMTNTIFDFSGLTVAKRIQLAEDLWDSVAPEGREVPRHLLKRPSLIARCGGQRVGER